MPTAQSILLDLRYAGVQPGDTLIVHSSYKSLGKVAGGPAAVVEALKLAVGEDGLLAMPAFTFGDVKRFVIEESPSRVGIIAEVFRLSKDVIRSGHPTHSMAFWGKDAPALAEAHERTNGLDVGSPYDLAAQRQRAFILQIGVSATTNSYVHVCEAHLDLPYVEQTYWFNQQHAYEIVYPDGHVRYRLNYRVPGCSKNFGVVDEELQQMGRLHGCRIGAAECRLLEPKDVFEAVKRLVENRRDALLCDNADCGFCPSARTAL